MIPSSLRLHTRGTPEGRNEPVESAPESVAALGKAVAALADADERARVEAEDADAPQIDEDAVTEFQTVPLARRLERALANARRDALAPLIVQEYVEARAAATAAGDTAAVDGFFYSDMACAHI